MTDRPVYGLTVLRYADGRTEIVETCDEDPDRYPEDWDALPMPSDWRLRYAMLIDAAAEVKREVGVLYRVKITPDGGHCLVQARNEAITLEEFDTALLAAIHDGTGVGLSIFSVVMRLLHYVEGVMLEPEQLQLVARRLIKLGAMAALDSGIPVSGLHDVHVFVEHVARQAVAEWKDGE